MNLRNPAFIANVVNSLNLHSVIFTFSGIPDTSPRKTGLINGKPWYQIDEVVRCFWSGTNWQYRAWVSEETDYTQYIADGVGSTAFPWQADWSADGFTVTEGT